MSNTTYAVTVKNVHIGDPEIDITFHLVTPGAYDFYVLVHTLGEHADGLIQSDTRHVTAEVAEGHVVSKTVTFSTAQNNIHGIVYSEGIATQVRVIFRNQTDTRFSFTDGTEGGTGEPYATQGKYYDQHSGAGGSWFQTTTTTQS